MIIVGIFIGFNTHYENTIVWGVRCSFLFTIRAKVRSSIRTTSAWYCSKCTAVVPAVSSKSKIFVLWLHVWFPLDSVWILLKLLGMNPSTRIPLLMAGDWGGGGGERVLYSAVLVFLLLFFVLGSLPISLEIHFAAEDFLPPKRALSKNSEHAPHPRGTAIIKLSGISLPTYNL